MIKLGWLRHRGQDQNMTCAATGKMADEPRLRDPCVNASESAGTCRPKRPDLRWLRLLVVRQVRKWLSHRGRAAALLAALSSAGCTSICNDFIVDTSTNDPMIFAPGSAPKAVLYVPMDNFTLSCDEAAVKVGNAGFVLTKKLFVGLLGRGLVAELQPGVALALAEGARANNGYDQLLQGLGGPLKSTEGGKVCELQSKGRGL